MKPRCDRVIVVEGKYDKIRLESCLDATVLTTDGFGLFHDEEKRALLRRLAKEKGLVILSDSDGAGGVIRSHLHTLTGGEGIVDLYVPPRKGKEKRKAAAGKAGLLGVEGIDNETIVSLFERAHLLSEEKEPRKPRYTKYDLYRTGYLGTDGASEKRRAFLRRNLLPETLSSGAFLDVINLLELEL